MVVYILCYDYSAPQQIQQEQISYWLDFLQSTLPTTPITSKSSPKWQVMVVGTKSDKCNAEARQSSSLPISTSWESLWPNVPLHSHQYVVSSHQMSGIDDFLEKLEDICNIIFEKHSLLVPQIYNSFAKVIKNSSEQSIITIQQLEDFWDTHFDKEQKEEEEEKNKEEKEKEKKEEEEEEKEEERRRMHWQSKMLDPRTNELPEQLKKLLLSDEQKIRRKKEKQKKKQEEKQKRKDAEKKKKEEDKRQEKKKKKQEFLHSLKYFHAIGHIVLLHELVCVQPQVIPKIMAEFISPKAVQNKLMTKYRVIFLTKRQIGAVLSLKEHHKELNDKLSLMEHIGVCFKLTHSIDTTSYFLFPSLAPHEEHIQFTNYANETIKYIGMRITAPENKVFTSVFFCLVIIQLCKFLNISEKELIVVCKNGVVMECAGIFCGQLLLKLEKDMRSIVCLMLAFNPTVAFVSHTFCQLIQTKFEQYIGYTEHKLCPSCIEPNLPTEELESLKRNANLCLKHIIQSRQIPDSHQHVLINRCKTHNSDKHHIFVSYRVDSEGKQTPFTSVERAGGFVELVYWELAPQKLQYGSEISVFWDKMCLNDGCDWEEGFLHGITSSNMIVLIVSNKVIEGICTKATTGQDNVLVEYECALLQYRKRGTPVIPIFVADIDEHGNFVEFDFTKANSLLPNAVHVRDTCANDVIKKLSESLPEKKIEFLTSIAMTLKKIFKQQGIFMKHRGDPEEMKELTRRVLAVLNKHHL
eukprot:Phypoly_transcript_02556.p1 GENE.Phypoly_transcript_02556~~Phypoly_transcript_02556.p1  ORF type:complete len:750 (+),score=131.28 Phypoly_transcript_02556:408-2657(+)